MKNISVIGAGAWGTTLAVLLAEKGLNVKLWAYEKEVAETIIQKRENNKYLPGFVIPSKIEITSDLKTVCPADIYIFAVPTQFLRKIAQQLKDSIDPKEIIVCASKGIETGRLKLPLEILEEKIGINNLVALSGPNLSKEISKGLPAAAVVASKSESIAKQVQQVLMLNRFRVYLNKDPIGVQLGGALKNVIAIAAGITDGLNLGNNAKSGLLIRGIAEITRLGIALGANPKTFAGLSGMGDLITTCSSQLSRNHHVGEQIAQGKKLKDILSEMNAVAEGVETTKAALALAKKHKVELPIAEEINAILFKGKDPYQSMTDLMTREAKAE